MYRLSAKYFTGRKITTLINIIIVLAIIFSLINFLPIISSLNMMLSMYSRMTNTVVYISSTEGIRGINALYVPYINRSKDIRSDLFFNDNDLKLISSIRGVSRVVKILRVTGSDWGRVEILNESSGEYSVVGVDLVGIETDKLEGILTDFNKLGLTRLSPMYRPGLI